MQNNEFKSFLFEEIRDHLNEIDNKVGNEDYDAIEYHLAKAGKLLTMIEESEEKQQVIHPVNWKRLPGVM